MTSDVTAVDTSSPIGSYRAAWLGYSNDIEIRNEAASGGIVSTVLCYLLEQKKIDAALVCKTVFKEGRMQHDVFLAKTREEVLSARTSKYFDIPILKYLDLIRKFDGKVAVVGLPCQINVVHQKRLMSPIFAEKIVFTMSVFCGHNSKQELIRQVWNKKNIKEEDIEEFYYRKGLWRGKMIAKLKSGETTSFRFQEFSHYQNLHILSLERCLSCHDHMGYYADLSTGDVWMKQMRDEKVKHSIFMARTEYAQGLIEDMVKNNRLSAVATDRKTVYRSQMRSINYHYNLTARARVGKWFGVHIKDRVNSEVRLQDYLGALVVIINHKISKSPRLVRWFMRLPKPIILLYVYLFKGLMHYHRKTY